MTDLPQELTEGVGQLLDTRFLDNPLSRWGIALAVAAAALVALRLVRAVSLRRLRKLTARTTNVVDDLILDLVEKTHPLFLLVTAVYLGSQSLALGPGVVRGLGNTFSAALFIQVGLWANEVLVFVIANYLKRRDGGQTDGPRIAVIHLFGFFGRIAVWSLVVLLGLDNLGFDVTAAIAGLGIGGVAVALALQNLLGDTFASLSIILDRPFEVGDFIVVDDLAGTVEAIGIKTTRLRALSGEQLVFGNNDLLTTRVRNFKRMYERRILFSFGVLYQTPPEEVEAIPPKVKEIIDSLEHARFDRAHFKAFGDSSLDFEVVYYVEVPEFVVYMDIQQQINLRLMRYFAERRIDFAYPTRTLYLEGGERPITVRAETAEPPRPPAIPV